MDEAGAKGPGRLAHGLAGENHGERYCIVLCSLKGCPFGHRCWPGSRERDDSVPRMDLSYPARFRNVRLGPPYVPRVVSAGRHPEKRSMVSEIFRTQVPSDGVNAAGRVMLDAMHFEPDRNKTCWPDAISR